MAYDKKLCEELRELVHGTVKDLTHIGTRVSACGECIVIRIDFGSQTKEISIPVIDVLANKNSCKGFLDLIKSRLERMLNGP